MSRDWTNSTVTFVSSNKSNGAPDLDGGNLWYHEAENVFYTGLTGGPPTFDEGQKATGPQLWTVTPDGDGGATWNEIMPTNDTSAWASVKRMYAAQTAYGGDNVWAVGGKDVGEAALQGMIGFDMNARALTNHTDRSIPGVKLGLKQGAMQYVPSFGPQGIFIVMRGNIAGSDAEISLDTVYIFDPAQGDWHT